MFLELKDYKLRFIRDDRAELKKGINVGLHNLMPVNKYSFGYIEETRGDGTGFNYGVREFSDGKLYWHHSSTIQPILPVLVSDDKIEVGDKFYLDSGELRTCKETFKEDKLNHGVVYDEFGKWHFNKWVNKVVATSEQIGLTVNWGPPHDHNFDWRYDEDRKEYAYLEAYIPTILHRAVKKGCKMRVVVEVICPHYGGSHIGKDCSCKSGFVIRPKLRDGRILMDGYGLLKKKAGYYFH